VGNAGGGAGRGVDFAKRLKSGEIQLGNAGEPEKIARGTLV
jgi:hypothetical protein